MNDLTARPAREDREHTTCINCHERVAVSGGIWLHDSNDSEVCPDYVQYGGVGS